MRSSSRDYAQRLLEIRKSEGMTQKEFSAVTGVPLNTIQKYESGHQPARAEIMERIISSEMFEKYSLWLTVNKTAPDAGQIAPTLSDSQESKAKLGRKAKNAEKVVTQISSQKPDMQAIISSLSNLDDDELKQLSKQLSRQGIMSFLDFLDPENQSLVNLEGKKRRAALRLESMGEKQLREILSKIELSDESFKEDVNNPIGHLEKLKIFNESRTYL